MPMTVRDAVEATLMGRDIRLVQRCDVDRIVVALEGYGCYDVPMLIDALESSFGELQMQVGTAAAPAFLALLKAHLRKPADSEPPSTPQGAPPSTPSTGAPPSYVPPFEPTPTWLPVISTVKFNGKTIAERSSVSLLTTATWGEAARLRLGEQASNYASLPLKVDLYPNGQQVTRCEPNRSPIVLGRPCLVLDRSCSRRPLRAPTRSSHMAKPRVKRSMYARLRSVDDRCVDARSVSVTASVRQSLMLWAAALRWATRLPCSRSARPSTVVHARQLRARPYFPR
jgi:hypothetical protein